MMKKHRTQQDAAVKAAREKAYQDSRNRYCMSSIRGIGNRIEQARKKNDRTQEDLASILGVDRVMISNYEREEIVEYPLCRPVIIANYCEVDPCWLVFGRGSMQPDLHPALDLRALGIVMEDVLAYARKHNLRPAVGNIVEAVIYAYRHFVTTRGIEREKLKEMLKLIFH